jgi:hypothetical protein
VTFWPTLKESSFRTYADPPRKSIFILFPFARFGDFRSVALCSLPYKQKILKNINFARATLLQVCFTVFCLFRISLSRGETRKDRLFASLSISYFPL